MRNDDSHSSLEAFSSDLFLILIENGKTLHTPTLMMRGFMLSYVEMDTNYQQLNYDSNVQLEGFLSGYKKKKKKKKKKKV